MGGDSSQGDHSLEEMKVAGAHHGHSLMKENEIIIAILD